MALERFLEDLAAEGRVRLAPPQPPTPESRQAADRVLRTLADRAALELPGPAPEFSPQAARWAAERLHFACQAFAYRELSAAEVDAGLGLPCPVPPSASSAWSVDLTLRQLPALLALARGFSPGDPLLVGLRALAQRWPLSSVSVAALEQLEGLEPVLEDPTLRRFYVDRVLQHRDLQRLDDERVREAARAALGIHSELCPEVAAALGEEPV